MSISCTIRRLLEIFVRIKEQKKESEIIVQNYQRQEFAFIAWKHWSTDIYKNARPTAFAFGLLDMNMKFVCLGLKPAFGTSGKP